MSLNVGVCRLCPVKYERIKFLVIALKNAVEVYAWAPKPYHKFMAFKVFQLCSCLPDELRKSSQTDEQTR